MLKQRNVRFKVLPSGSPLGCNKEEILCFCLLGVMLTLYFSRPDSPGMVVFPAIRGRACESEFTLCQFFLSPCAPGLPSRRELLERVPVFSVCSTFITVILCLLRAALLPLARRAVAKLQCWLSKAFPEFSNSRESIKLTCDFDFK